MRYILVYFLVFSFSNPGLAETTATYSRSDWVHWIDYDGDCQNERAELLIRTSLERVKFYKRSKCAVISGKWYDPYTAQTLYKAISVDVDHIVPLAWANSHGGSQWTKKRKMDFANLSINLLPVSATANRSKGNKGPDQWMPENKYYRCDYLKKFDEIVSLYSLQYTPREIRIIERMKQSCS